MLDWTFTDWLVIFVLFFQAANLVLQLWGRVHLRRKAPEANEQIPVENGKSAEDQKFEEFYRRLLTGGDNGEESE